MKKSNILISSSVISLTLFLMLLSGCNFTTHYVQTGSRVYEETRPENVKIYSGEPKEEYIVIGSIAVDHVGEDSQAGIEYLQKKAAKIGADAVIFTKLSSIMTSSARMGINGVAVKFKK
jgi:hypothetical protein